MGTGGTEPGAAEKARRSLARLGRALPGHPALLPSELPGWMPWGEVTAYPDHGRRHRPANRIVCGWPASALGMKAKLGQEEKEMQSGKPRACLGRGWPWTKRPLSVPQATGGLMGATELGTAWL